MVYIYRILCIINEKVYIGATQNIEIRKYNHWWRLQNNRHENSDIQKDYNIYGKEKFLIDILDTCFDDEADELEQFWIDAHGSMESDDVYNLFGGGRRTRGCKKVRDKQIASNKKRVLSADSKKKISDGVKKAFADGRLKREKSEEHQKKINESLRESWKKRKEQNKIKAGSKIPANTY